MFLCSIKGTCSSAPTCHPTSSRAQARSNSPRSGGTGATRSPPFGGEHGEDPQFDRAEHDAKLKAGQVTCKSLISRPHGHCQTARASKKPPIDPYDGTPSRSLCRCPQPRSGAASGGGLEVGPPQSDNRQLHRAAGPSASVRRLKCRRLHPNPRLHFVYDVSASWI